MRANAGVQAETKPQACGAGWETQSFDAEDSAAPLGDASEQIDSSLRRNRMMKITRAEPDREKLLRPYPDWDGSFFVCVQVAGPTGRLCLLWPPFDPHFALVLLATALARGHGDVFSFRSCILVSSCSTKCIYITPDMTLKCDWEKRVPRVAYPWDLIHHKFATSHPLQVG